MEYERKPGYLSSTKVYITNDEASGLPVKFSGSVTLSIKMMRN
jgi:hypothetical protein